ncbi:putative NADH-plastoquinone oxidoreductase, subunit I [Lupinus albus]|uniref:Putative NADH-plastoquinone oxidoreductase, subunit I n=1 Tax=Lupinus albus TaxID=3870 RepID=A0A6A4NKD3_LUPAL|nr:putative NADH-plastoquinone oxidoreductase, subunit I [Lupinus albus]
MSRIGSNFISIIPHISHDLNIIGKPSLKRFRSQIHFKFDKCITCEVCFRMYPIDLPVVDWKLEIDIRKKQLLNYSIDFGICIFCGNCVEDLQENL